MVLIMVKSGVGIAQTRKTNQYEIADSFQQTDMSDKIDELLLPLVRTNNYNGTLLVTKEGDILFSKSYGKMD